MKEYAELEEGLKASLDRYNKYKVSNNKSILPVKNASDNKKIKPARSKKPWKPSEGEVKHIITLLVRKKKIAADEFFTYHSTKLSRLDARYEAEKAARDAGYPEIAYIQDWKTL